MVNILIIIGSYNSIWISYVFGCVKQSLTFLGSLNLTLKNEIFWHYQRLTQRFYKNNRTGDLMNRISEDVGKVRMYVGPAFMYSINTISLFIIVISYMISIAPELTLYTILPLTYFICISIYKLSKIINIKSTLVQEILIQNVIFCTRRF